VLEDQAKTLLESWENAPFFLDLSLIDGIVPSICGVGHPLVHIAERARIFRLFLIPVTGLNRKAAYQSAVSRVVQLDRRGACLRLVASETARPSFARAVETVLGDLGLEKSDVDLLLDYQTFDNDQPPLKALLSSIPNLCAWRTVSVASGAFPADLQKYRPGSHLIPRNDWLRWKWNYLHETTVPRQPSFPDYTIQYGQYREPPRRCNPSASIRYTLDNDWLVMRGEGIFNKKSPGRVQWTKNAILLRDRPEFYGAEFSCGDAFILKKSNEPRNHGSPEVWIRAGINHHMTVVSRQIANLAVP